MVVQESASTVSRSQQKVMPDDIDIEHVTGDAARALLVDPIFRQRWAALYQGCPWATPFQSPEYAITWYESYGERVDPVLLTGTADGTLVGLLALAVTADTSQLLPAGGHQAEYQGWLALEPFGNAFPLAAIRACQKTIAGSPLTFQYLPPDAPLEWLQRWPLHEKESFDRPEMQINAAAAEEALGKRRYRTRLTKLGKLGDFRFERLETVEALAAVFDQIEALYDLRQGGIGASLAFAVDPLKRLFHLNLMRHRGLLHATVLRIDRTLLGAHLGLSGRGILHLGTLAHSPLYAKDSPGRLHVMLLAKLLADEGYTTLDLTPGNDPWKEPFATGHQHVVKLTVWGDRVAFARHKAMTRLADAARWSLRKVGSSPSGVRGYLGAAQGRGIGGLSRAVAGRARKWMSFEKELRIYSFAADRVAAPQDPKDFNRDALGDLLQFEEAVDQRSKASFLSDALARLEQGQHVYTTVDTGRLVHFGWLVERQETSFLSEVNQTFTLPPASAVLYDFYTHPSARGRGLYQAAMRQMLRDAVSVPGTEHVFIFVLADNLASRHAIEKVGFQYQGSLFERGRFGKTERW